MTSQDAKWRIGECNGRLHCSMASRGKWKDSELKVARPVSVKGRILAMVRS